MRSEWDLTPFETVLIVTAATAMAGGLWAVVG